MRGAVSPAVMDTAQSDKERLETANKAAEDLTRLSNRKLKFEYQKETDVFQVSVMDDENKVIRKIPADSVLRMIEHIREVLGLVLDEARSNGARLSVTALVDQFYAEVQAMGGNRWDTSSLAARLQNRSH